MSFRWLLTYLRMCGYTCDVIACHTFTGEVLRIAPLDCFGILATGLIVQSFDYNGASIVVYLE